MKVNFRELPNLTTVELPCQFKQRGDASRAMNTGPSSGSAVAAGASSVTANIPALGNLSCRRQQRSGLVLRIKADANIGEQRVEVVGKVGFNYANAAAHDFQFLPASTDLMCNTSSSPIIEIPPTPFGWPLAEARLAHRLFQDKEKTEVKKKSTVPAAPLSLIRFGDPLPSKPEMNDRLVKMKSNNKTVRSGDLIQELEKILDDIPVLSRKSIELYPTFSDKHYLLAELIPQVCYCYTTGPFKGLLVRHGYNPSMRPDARYFQAVNVRMQLGALRTMQQKIWEHLGKPTSMVVADLDNMTSRLATAEDSEQAAGEEKLDGRRPMGTDISSSASYVTIILFRTVIKMQFTTQICSLSDEDIFKFVSTMKRLSTCHATSGWFPPEGLALLRHRILTCLLRRVDEFIGAPRSITGVPTSSPDINWGKRYSSIPDVVMNQTDFLQVINEASILHGQLASQRLLRRRLHRQGKAVRSSQVSAATSGTGNESGGPRVASTLLPRPNPRRNLAPVSRKRKPGASTNLDDNSRVSEFQQFQLQNIGSYEQQIGDLLDGAQGYGILECDEGDDGDVDDIEGLEEGDFDNEYIDDEEGSDEECSGEEGPALDVEDEPEGLAKEAPRGKRQKLVSYKSTSKGKPSIVDVDEQNVYLV